MRTYDWPVHSGRYRLPPSLRRLLDERLGTIKPQRSTGIAKIKRAWRLMVGIARMHGVDPDRTFALDRRALCAIPDLGMTEAELRSAIAVLEDHDLVMRVSSHEPTHAKRSDGSFCRKAIIFRLGVSVVSIINKIQYASKRPVIKTHKEKKPRSGAYGRISSRPSTPTPKAASSAPPTDGESPLDRALKRLSSNLKKLAILKKKGGETPSRTGPDNTWLSFLAPIINTR